MSACKHIDLWKKVVLFLKLNLNKVLDKSIEGFT